MNEAHAENLTHAVSLQHTYWNSNTLSIGVKTGNYPSAKCLSYRDQILNMYTLLSH